MKTIAEMTDEELELENQRLGREQDSIRDLRKVLATEIRRRFEEREAPMRAARAAMKAAAAARKGS